jgi:hypothetical protein
MKSQPSVAKQFLAIRNTSLRNVTVIFEPWLSEVVLEPDKQLDIEIIGTLELAPDVKTDVCPQIWIGDDGHIAIHSPREAIPRAFIDGNEVPDITY